MKPVAATRYPRPSSPIALAAMTFTLTVGFEGRGAGFKPLLARVGPPPDGVVRHPRINVLNP